MERVLIKAQGSLTYDTLRLSNKALEGLAITLVEFAEDVYNDIGIWHSVEQYNLQFFGTRLPFLLMPDDNAQLNPCDKYRIQHLLWGLFAEVNPQLILSPTHNDLQMIAELSSDFLEKRFAQIPRGSGIDSFLAQTNDYGWDIKKKLIWMGQHSYLFRESFINYVSDRGKEVEIPVIEDFICQQTTVWSGLGIIDVLAATQALSEEEISVLRHWYDRHTAYYRVIAIDGSELILKNLVSDESYTVRLAHDIKWEVGAGNVVFGSLLPWNREWFWSGTQTVLGLIPEDAVSDLISDYLKHVPLFAYRYSNELAIKAQESVKRQYNEFINYHGADFVLYPDGISFAADWQKRSRLQWESKPKEVISQAMEDYNLQNPWASMSFPSDLINCRDGVGVYYNSEEGEEYMTGMSHILSGLDKKGENMNEDEEEAIRSFICSESISPRFVWRLVQDYGPETISAAFLLRGKHDELNLEYLLRRYKGAYFRKRYPRITLS
jgi:hypothetical protein